MVAVTVTVSYDVYLRKPSTPKVGTSMALRLGTPSDFRRSMKLLHSLMISPHSASALPAYFASGTVGFLGETSLTIPGTVLTRKACAGAGRRGGPSRRLSWSVGRSLLLLEAWRPGRG